MKPSSNRALTFLFLLVEAILYWLLLNNGGNVFTVSAYGGIVLCFLYVLFRVRSGAWRFAAALACTLGADYFLVVMSPQQQLPGMVFFLFAQGLYAWQLHSTCKKKWPLYLRLALTAVAVAITCIALRENIDALALISLCYYANLIMNLVLSWMQFSRYPLAAIGFILFLICDTVIGLQVAISGYLPMEEGSVLNDILYPGFNLSWLFYLPSQVLLALNSRKK